ncbi:MAG TPA: M20/M25/M40 family metallo-hydrolase, partial [Gemmatimonadaceae bacterium]|nr:M20/M25/M40 family metallo-hydrolase [Gemmatimonadaceae bacterium]
PSSVMRLSLASGGTATAVHRTEFQIQAPAIAPDGSRVAFQQMPREDWEIMVASATDTVAQRVTTEIQHDLSPAFLSPTRLIGLIGEARHRRSYVYDLPAMTRTRLFHNNTVRTIAPEYEWVPSPDGSKVLIVAERDGDTVTPHRHLYCIDLTQPVTRAALVARVDSALSAERSLRAFAVRSFAAIDTSVRAATRAVDVGRVYDYARTLHSFGSKFWTQPGNQRAREYLLATYKSFGYEPSFQTFTPAGRGGGRGGAGSITETANVVAVLPGTVNPELVYVVGSHFDSVQPGPGADDNSSGTTALLEAARVLATRPQPATIIFVSFTGEEGGLLGSREFVRRARDSLKVVGALNNDMVGFANDERLDNTIRYSNAGIKDIQHAAAIRYSNLITYDAFYYKSTDAAAFFDAYGDIVGGIGSYPVLGNPHYHQSHDVLETINQQLVAEVSRTTVATLMLLASSPSRITGLAATRSGSAVTLKWNASPEKGIARYIVSYRGANGVTKRVPVTAPTTRLIDAPPGTEISVKAVNARGLEGWDWARVIAQ